MLSQITGIGRTNQILKEGNWKYNVSVWIAPGDLNRRIYFIKYIFHYIWYFIKFWRKVIENITLQFGLNQVSNESTHVFDISSFASNSYLRHKLVW